APDAPPGQNSLFWSAYAAGKRGFACEFDSAAGRDVVRQLARRADVLIESAEPGKMQALGLDFETLSAQNPALVYVTITAFGSDGPKGRYAATDLIVWAAAGPLGLCRDNAGVPLRISVPQAFLHAGADAAAGALIALFSRRSSGRGQHVDISAQQSAALATLSATLAAQVGHENFQFPADGPRRVGQLDLSGSGARTRRSKWRVADGLLEMHLGMGPAAGGSANRLFEWMRSEGALPPEFYDWDWVALPQRILAGEIDDAQLERARDAVAAFLRSRRKQDLMDEALRRGILMAPAMTTADLVNSRQFAARGLFTEVNEDARPRLLPANFIAGCPQGLVALRPAPRLGEHTAEVCRDWLGMDVQAVARSRAQGILR
ncbi:MAG: CoA transferase, partial [Gammaproteobacteria bacterium]|nr:CoA transferase [Gammaproteobacteria bacterium]